MCIHICICLYLYIYIYLCLSVCVSYSYPPWSKARVVGLAHLCFAYRAMGGTQGVSDRGRPATDHGDGFHSP